MNGPEHPLLAAARELERRDAELAARIEELTHLEAEIAELRADARRVARVRAGLPARRERASAQFREAQLELARRHTALSAAQRGSASERDEAERALATAETALADAQARTGRVRAEQERIDEDAAGAESDSARLSARAHEIAQRAGGVARDDVEQWAARARAAVFAQRTHAEGERQRIQTEASELASAVTGEALVGDVTRVRHAVEAALRV